MTELLERLTKASVPLPPTRESPCRVALVGRVRQ
ncbi:predicted protein [Streptomyces viridosporus ATCC 14672]|uniref:Predicted protein n=1 Tax=Streptomyces viridosporus (strain ATCC 14672 / DSM 40746 / JCM 4963 / KCTC 9882 / NRRL B-12104 / FH 1290) TaxID=566461 RepID=D5ZVL1_STRV1|nr:predicted protein [Streptomyces viridosporus ATCC 14672]